MAAAHPGPVSLADGHTQSLPRSPMVMPRTARMLRILFSEQGHQRRSKPECEIQHSFLYTVIPRGVSSLAAAEGAIS